MIIMYLFIEVVEVLLSLDDTGLSFLHHLTAGTVISGKAAFSWSTSREKLVEYLFNSDVPVKSLLRLMNHKDNHGNTSLSRAFRHKCAEIGLVMFKFLMLNYKEHQTG